MTYRDAFKTGFKWLLLGYCAIFAAYTTADLWNYYQSTGELALTRSEIAAAIAGCWK